MRLFVGGLVAAVLALPVVAMAAVPVETAKLKGQKIALHVHPFLTEQELQTLRLVMTNRQALELFITSKGYSAIAVAPDEGFIRDNSPVKSAFAIGDFPSAEEAAAAAMKGCDAARKGGAACVVVLEVGPAN